MIEVTVLLLAVASAINSARVDRLQREVRALQEDRNEILQAWIEAPTRHELNAMRAELDEQRRAWPC